MHKKSKTRTEIYKRETTDGLIIISKKACNHTMVMTLTPKQWEALKTADKPVVVIKGGDVSDPEMECKIYEEEEKCLQCSKES